MKLMKGKLFREKMELIAKPYNVPEHVMNKLINFLIKRCDCPEDLTPLIQTLKTMQE